MDAQAHIRCLVDGMFIKVSWVQDLMEELSITGISEVWGEELGYYVWFSNAVGAYALGLDSCCVTGPENALPKAVFSIRCFPYTNSKVFETFSPNEKALITSSIFDHTNTPRYECKEAIPPGLFRVGLIEIIADPRCAAAVFSLTSLDVLTTRASPSEIMTNVEKKSRRRISDGASIRQVPGWSMAYPLFDCLISMFAFYSAAHPSLALHSESRGFELVSDDETEDFRAVDSDATHIKTVLVAFNGNVCNESHLLDSYLRDQVSSGACDVLFDSVSSGLNSSHAILDTAAKQSMLNPLWWEIPHRRYTSKLSTTCGCE